MSVLDDLFEPWEQADYDTLVDRAKEAIENLMPLCKEIDTKQHGKLMMATLILGAIYADDDVNEDERKMLAKIWDADFESMMESCYNSADEIEGFAPKMMELMNNDYLANIIMLSLAIAAADGIINEKEREFIRAYCE